VPYFVTDRHPECSAWAVVKEDGELLSCQGSEEDAIEQMVAVSLAEDLEPGGSYEGESFRAALGNDKYTTSSEASARADAIGCSGFHSMTEDGEEIFMPCDSHDAYERVVGSGSYRALPGDLVEGDFVRWDSSGGTARGQVEYVMKDGTLGIPDSSFSINASEEDPAALIRVWRPVEGEGYEPTETLVGHRFSTLTKIDSLRSESREVQLEPPAYMRAAARRGVAYFEEGLGGDGLVDRTIREARAMARGSVTAEKWVRISAWIARHLGDLDAPAANPDNEGYPSAGVVAHLLWGSGPSKAAARRTLRYAEGVISRLEQENEGRTKGEALKKMETRTLSVDYEIRETDNGMLFEGYAAVFDSPSQPLPFTERIAPGAFARSLKNRNDVKLMWNHDAGSILGSSRAGTLKLVEDGRGLKVTAELPNTTLGRDTAELLRRGDVDAMSFGFSVPKNGDSWSEDGSERTLKEIRLHEVSIVAFPAYTATAGTATVRALDRLALRANVDVDALADALLKLENGEDMSAADRGVLSNVLDTLAPEDVDQDATIEKTSDLGLDLLALKKKKLELLKGQYNG